MAEIPGSDGITNVMVLDWILNTGPEDLVGPNALTYEHIRELVEGMREEGEVLEFTNDDYKRMYNFFTTFVREYYGPEGQANIVQGGKRRRHKRTKSHKKTRRGKKKTRKHK